MESCQSKGHFSIFNNKCIMTQKGTLTRSVCSTCHMPSVLNSWITTEWQYTVIPSLKLKIRMEHDIPLFVHWMVLFQASRLLCIWPMTPLLFRHFYHTFSPNLTIQCIKMLKTTQKSKLNTAKRRKLARFHCAQWSPIFSHWKVPLRSHKCSPLPTCFLLLPPVRPPRWPA